MTADVQKGRTGEQARVTVVPLKGLQFVRTVTQIEVRALIDVFLGGQHAERRRQSAVSLHDAMANFIDGRTAPAAFCCCFPRLNGGR